LSGYQPRHAKPDQLPVILRGLADLIVIVDSDDGK
jgi:hypothetical protein